MLGEHTVLHGSAAFAVPLRRYSAQIALQNSSFSGHQLPTNDGINASFSFERWVAFAKTSKELEGILDFSRWDLEAHDLRVYANIPIGYGLGSSGAITAEAYRRYAHVHETNPTLLRNQLAALESFFHGKSSGLDPLVSYLDKAIYISPSGNVIPVEVGDSIPTFSSEGGWFLVDSGQPRAGKEAISRFGESCKDDAWRGEVLVPLNHLVEALAQGFKAKNLTKLQGSLKMLSAIQLAELSFLIPPKISMLWEEWLAADLAYLKLCGAGGGGFFLGYASDKSKIQQEVIWL